MAGLTIIIAVFIISDRNSLIALISLLASLALVVKTRLRPSKSDLGLSIGLAAVAALAWAGTWLYVVSTYETGEVVELEIDTDKGAHTARVWIFEMGSESFVYYDADPDIAHALLLGKPLQIVREGKISTRVPKATKVDSLSEKSANEVFTAMQSKYGKRMHAANIYYLMIGSPRDRVSLIVNLERPLI